MKTDVARDLPLETRLSAALDGLSAKEKGRGILHGNVFYFSKNRKFDAIEPLWPKNMDKKRGRI